MYYTPPFFNVIYQDPQLEMQQYLNKLVSDGKLNQSYCNVYALMPSDNASPIAAGSDIAFPRLGPSSNTDIIPNSTTQLLIGPIGAYQVSYQASFDVSGQLVLSLNNVEQNYTVVGRSSPNSTVSGTFLVNTVVPNSLLTVRNPASASSSLTFTSNAGGNIPVSANLVVTRLK